MFWASTYFLRRQAEQLSWGLSLPRGAIEAEELFGSNNASNMALSVLAG